MQYPEKQAGDLSLSYTALYRKINLLNQQKTESLQLQSVMEIFRECYALLPELQLRDSISLHEIIVFGMYPILSKLEKNADLDSAISEFIKNLPLSANIRILNHHSFQTFFNCALELLDKIDNASLREKLNKEIINKFAYFDRKIFNEDGVTIQETTKSFSLEILEFWKYAKQVLAKNSAVKEDIENFIVQYAGKIKTTPPLEIRKLNDFYSVLYELSPSDKCCKEVIGKFAENASEKFFVEFLKYIPDGCLTPDVKEYVVKLYFDKYAIPGFKQILAVRSNVTCFDDYLGHASVSEVTKQGVLKIPADSETISAILNESWTQLRNFLSIFSCEEVGAFYFGLKQLFFVVAKSCTKNKFLETENAGNSDCIDLDFKDMSNFFSLLRSESCIALLSNDTFFSSCIRQIINMCFCEICSKAENIVSKAEDIRKKTECGETKNADKIRSTFVRIVDMLNNILSLCEAAKSIKNFQYDELVFDHILTKVIELLSKDPQISCFCKKALFNEGKTKEECLMALAKTSLNLRKDIKPGRVACFFGYNRPEDRLLVAEGLGKLTTKLEELAKVMAIKEMPKLYQ